MKAKRRLSDFSFEKKGCHVSLVGESLGGPANGRTVLALKAVNSKTEENMSMIEKAAHEAAVQKAVKEAVEPVQKALEAAQEELKVIKAKETEAVEKSRKDALAEVIGKDSPELEATFATVKSLDDAAFALVVKSLKAAHEALAKSEMFNEKGHGGEANVTNESREMSILKSKYTKQ